MPGATLYTSTAVVGAGPAGARAAELLAAQGEPVLMLDPKAPWEKPCGGGLTESTFHDVPELRELEPEMQATRSMRVESDAEHGFSVPLTKPIRLISRVSLARWQLDRALASGATLVGERVRAIRRGGAGWLIDTDQRRIHARRLVGADGAASLVRRTIAPKHQVELAPTRVSYVPGAGPTPEVVLVRLFPRMEGYVWDFPRPDHRSVGVGLQSGRWRRPRMDAVVDAFRQSTEECRCDDGEVQRAGAVIGTAQLGHGDFSHIGGIDVALLGDAAGLADPATGEGIRNALRSASLLASALREGAGSFERYPELARSAFEREFAVSRILRRFVFEGDRGLRIVGMAERSALAYALIATVADGINEHDSSVLSLARRWWRAVRALNRESSSPPSRRRVPVPCPRGCESGWGGTHPPLQTSDQLACGRRLVWRGLTGRPVSDVGSLASL